MPQRVCVIGLGYVGFSTTCVLANSGFLVLGVDTDTSVIFKIQANNFISSEEHLQNLFLKGALDGNIVVSTQIQLADIYIITVQTPLTAELKADLSYLNSAIDSIKSFIKPGNLVIIESTCPIGTTEDVYKVLSSVCPEIHVAYCPERILPGDIVNELMNNNRIVGGVDKQSSLLAAEFYKSFIQGKIEITDSKTAEAVKLAENTYRDINIAYANELSMIFDDTNINIYELIRLANQHPRVQILQPGPGVGGHCIAVDPYFLAESFPELARLTLKAREVNIDKTDWVIKKIRRLARANDIKTLACFGLTYKPNIEDIRQSPSLVIIKHLRKEFDVISVDPYVQNTASIDYALTKATMIVMLVAHQEFLNIPKHFLDRKLFLDFTGVFVR